MYDGNAENSQIIGRFLGNTLPDKVQSSGNFTKIVFETDSSVQRIGFQSVYYATSPSGTFVF